MSASPALAAFGEAWARREMLPASRGSVMHELRAAAMNRFERLGLPTVRDESWHYSNLRALSLRAFRPAPTNTAASAAGVTASPAAASSGAAAASTVDIALPTSWLDPAGMAHADTQAPGGLQPDAAWPVLHLLDGVPLAMMSTPQPGMRLQNLSWLEQTDPQHLARLSPPASDAEQQRWLLLNTALYEDGVHVRVTGECPRPLLIVHHAPAAGAATLSNPRVIIETEAHSRGIVIEHHLGGAEQELLRNSVCIVQLAAGAHLEHYRVFSNGANTTHFDHLLVRQAADSSFLQHTVALGGGFVRGTLEAALRAPGAALDSHALIAVNAADHCDGVNLVSHEAARTRSRQTARLIAGQHGRAIFNSKVVVAPGAQKTDSVQSCRGLLLSAGAEIDTRPQLEIHADDVKCAHGATTGRLDPDMLFYLLSRGLDRSAAQSLLVFAFLADVLTGMSLQSVRGAIEAHLVSQLPDSDILRQFR